MRLRDVQPIDIDTYTRIRCDPAMMAELGGPQPQSKIHDMVHRHARDTKAGTTLICMIIPADAPHEVAGTVPLTGDKQRAEIGWAVLPEFQGRGLAKQAVRLLLARAQEQGWHQVNAFPAVTNSASNAVCRATVRGQILPHQPLAARR